MQMLMIIFIFPFQPCWMVYADVRSKAVVPLLSIHCLVFLLFVSAGSVFGSCFVVHYLVFLLDLQSS